MSELPIPPAQISGLGSSPAGGIGIAISHVIRDKMLEGEQAAAQKREALAAQFEALATDPRYNSDPNVVTAAQRHAMRLRALGTHERLPKEYQPDPKTGGTPAYDQLVLQAHRSAQNAPPPKLEPPPNTGPMDFDRLFTAGGADAVQPPANVLPPIPGGVKRGPNAISPAPAVGATGSALPPPPAMVQHPGLPAGMESAGLDPIAQAHIAQQVSNIQNTIPLPQPGDTSVNKNALGYVGKANIRHQQTETDLRKHGMAGVYDEGGNLTGTRTLKPEEMSSTDLARTSYLKAHELLYNEQQKLTALKSQGLTPGTPQWDLQKRKIDILEQNAASRSANTDRQNKQFERDTYGTVGGQSVPGAMVDPQTGQTLGLKVPGSTLAQPTVLARNKADQGRVIIGQGNTLIRDIQQHADELGAWDGRLNLAAKDLGIADPAVRDLYTRLKSYAALQPQLHGARGVGYQKEFEDAIGSLKDNPDSVIASNTALNSLAGDFVQQVASKKTVHAGAKPTGSSKQTIPAATYDAAVKKFGRASVEAKYVRGQ